MGIFGEFLRNYLGSFWEYSGNSLGNYLGILWKLLWNSFGIFENSLGKYLGIPGEFLGILWGILWEKAAAGSRGRGGFPRISGKKERLGKVGTLFFHLGRESIVNYPLLIIN